MKKHLQVIFAIKFDLYHSVSVHILKINLEFKSELGHGSLQIDFPIEQQLDYTDSYIMSSRYVGTF